MANGDEHLMDGGVYTHDDERLDVYITENGPNKEGFFLDLTFVTGSTSFTVVEIPPTELIRMAKFLEKEAREAHELELKQSPR